MVPFYFSFDLDGFIFVFVSLMAFFTFIIHTVEDELTEQHGEKMVHLTYII